MATPVLALHSGGFTSRQWRRLAADLAPTRRVLTPDLTGYAARPRWPVGVPFHLETDLALIGELLVEPMHVVGHSYGGLLALQLALAHPDKVTSLALYEPVAFGALPTAEADAAERLLPRYDPANPEVWFEAFVDWWNGPGAWQTLAAPTKDAFRDVGWKLSEEVRTLMADRTGARYAGITQPTLLLGGGKTQPLELRVLDELRAMLPRATLRVFPALGHMGPIVDAAGVNAAIVEHVVASDA